MYLETKERIEKRAAELLKTAKYMTDPKMMTCPLCLAIYNMDARMSVQCYCDYDSPAFENS